MRAKSVLIFFILLMTSCAVNDQIVENQISVNSNQTAPVNQNTNTSYISNEPVKKEVDYFAHIKPEHRKVLRDWLKSKPYLRPGIEEIDNSMYEEKYKQNFEGNMRFLRETVGKNGYQYYSVGDMNRDGKKDFAVLLVDSRKDKDKVERFALGIFNAPFKKGQRPSYFEEGLAYITNSYIVFDLMIKKHLYLGKFESDVYCATYYPKGKTYYFKDCDG